MAERTQTKDTTELLSPIKAGSVKLASFHTELACKPDATQDLVNFAINMQRARLGSTVKSCQGAHTNRSYQF